MGKTTLTWDYDGLVGDGFKIYRADSPMNPENLPLPLATVGIGVREYVDETVIDNATYYYRIGSYIGGTERISVEIEHIAKKSGDPYWDNVVALLYFDGDLTDEKGNLWVAGGGAYVDENGLQMPANNTALVKSAQVAGDDTNWYSSSYTVEYKMTPTSYGQDISGRPILVRDGADLPGITSWQFGPVNDGFLVFSYWSGTAAVSTRSAAPCVPLFEETHMAFSFDKATSTIRIFADGVEVASRIVSAAPPLFSPNNIAIGYSSTGATSNGRASGTIQTIRITKGVARYTEDFTPPNEPFPNFGN